MISAARFVTAGVLSSTSAQVDIDLKTGAFTIKGPTGNTVIGDLEKGDVVARIDAAPVVEPLQIGGVTFFGDMARALRDVHAMLKAHGAGELAVVKPEEGLLERHLESTIRRVIREELKPGGMLHRG